MKKVSFLVACLISLTFPGLNASTTAECRKNDGKVKCCAYKHKDCLPSKYKFKKKFSASIGSATFCVTESTPLQLGYIPLTTKYVSRKGIEPTATGFKVKEEGIYLVGVSFKATGTDLVGPLTVSLTYGPCIQHVCPNNSHCSLPAKTTQELFKFETSGILNDFRQTTVKLSEDDVIDLSITSLPTSGTVSYPAGTDVAMIIQRVG